MSTHHPLYQRVKEEHRYAGKLSELLAYLRPKAFEIGGRTKATDCERDLDFAWVVLPRGAIVGLRIRQDDMRRELRIARTERPKDEKAVQAWQSEVETFLKHFGIEPLDGKTPAPEKNGWLPLPSNPNDEAKGAAAVRFLELRHGEIEINRARCAKCWSESGEHVVTEWFPVGGIEGQHCQRHAGLAGRDDESERQLSLMP